MVVLTGFEELTQFIIAAAVYHSDFAQQIIKNAAESDWNYNLIQSKYPVLDIYKVSGIYHYILSKSIFLVYANYEGGVQLKLLLL